MIHVVAGALIKENQLLACRRAPNTNLAGMWEFPGGKVESGENPMSALARELLEELSLVVTVGSLITSIKDEKSSIYFEVYQVFSRGNPLLSAAHDQLTWIAKDMLIELDWAPLDLPTVDFLSKNESKGIWGEH